MAISFFLTLSFVSVFAEIRGPGWVKIMIRNTSHFILTWLRNRGLSTLRALFAIIKFLKS
jgi:hypothetical protein